MRNTRKETAQAALPAGTRWIGSRTWEEGHTCWHRLARACDKDHAVDLHVFHLRPLTGPAERRQVEWTEVHHVGQGQLLVQARHRFQGLGRALPRAHRRNGRHLPAALQRRGWSASSESQTASRPASLEPRWSGPRQR